MDDLEVPEPKHREKIQAAAQPLFDALQGIVDSDDADSAYPEAVPTGWTLVSIESMQRAKALLESL